jgi:hypothetical protein
VEFPLMALGEIGDAKAVVLALGIKKRQVADGY